MKQDATEFERVGLTVPVTESLVYSPGVPPTNWVAVTDQFPEPWNADVLCWDAGDGGCVVGYLSGFRKPNRTEPVWVADVSGEIIELKRVTHWTLLPEAPRTGEVR